MFKDKQDSKWKTLSTIAQTLMILVLIVIVGIMMLRINQLQGTARVINYADLVRGATQRAVKLEIADQPNNDLIDRLDNILYDLKYEKGRYNLVSLDDKDYQNDLDTQMAYWEDLKKEIDKVRSEGYENTDIIDMSETYFDLADKTVAAAERYSEKIAQNIRLLEMLSAIVMIVLIMIIVYRTAFSIRMTRINRQLQKKAYLDLHTGLPNKSACERFFNDEQFINEPMAVIVYDLNNLKIVNDTLGHTVGDQFILNFSNILRDTIPEQDFVGRYGGDEFMAVIYNASRDKIDDINKKFDDAVNRFNKLHHSSEYIDISYAHGWAFSGDYKQCTFMTLFNKADKNMYQDKVRIKKTNGESDEQR